jgi:hypothetical protein
VLRAEDLVKRQTSDLTALFAGLHKHGIATLGSLILGWDGQIKTRIKIEIRLFYRIEPTFYQIIPLHPTAGTKLWQKLKKQHRIFNTK